MSLLSQRGQPLWNPRNGFFVSRTLRLFHNKTTLTYELRSTPHHEGNDNIIHPESLLCPADTRLCPFVEPTFIGKPAKCLAVGRKEDIEGEHLILADLARQPGMVKTVLYSLAQTADPIGVSDKIVTVEMTEFGMGVVRLGASLDVSGDGVA